MPSIAEGFLKNLQHNERGCVYIMPSLRGVEVGVCVCVCENLSFFVFLCKGLGCFLVPCLGTVHCCFLWESSVSIHLARQHVHYMEKRGKRNRGKSYGGGREKRVQECVK